MKDCPLVSCLMPTRNRREFLPRAIAMFAAQDWSNKELLILEDGEQGKSKEAVDGLLNLILRNALPVRYSYFSGTVGAKLNEAARVARGEILVRWDDDDWNSPTRISDQVRHMQLSGKPVVGMSSLVYYREDEDCAWQYTGDAWYASGSTHCYTREWALAHAYPDLSLNEDAVFWEQARQANAISTISGMTCLVACDHSKNTSPRVMDDELRRLVHETSDNYSKIPYSVIKATVGGYRLSVAA